MDFSFLRALRASVRLTLNNLKRDAKRLQRVSADVFGTSIPLSVCQEAYARARGFRSWHEAETILKRGGRDPGASPWKIENRNDVHQAVFSALVTADLELGENGPVCFFGAQADAALPAVCLWVESLSMADVSGIVLVDTKALSLQDTPLWTAVTRLGLEYLFDECRYIDARGANLDVAISTSPANWARSLLLAVPKATRETLEQDGFSHLLEKTLTAVADRRGRSDDFHVFADTVDLVVSSLCASMPYPPAPVRGVDGDFDDVGLSMDLQAYLERRKGQENLAVYALNSALEEKNIRLGYHLADESKHRPTIVLYDQDQPASLVLASVIHSLYYWRYVGHELRFRDIHTRPVLYLSDAAVPEVPAFIQESGSSYTCIVNGPKRADDTAWPECRGAHARFAQVEQGGFVYGGRRVRFNIEQEMGAMLQT